MANQRLAIKPGISSNNVQNIPDKWSAEWYRGHISNVLQQADSRNQVAGSGITLTPSPVGPSQPGTISVSTKVLGEPYLLATAPTDNLLTSYRVLAGQTGVISVTDGGATAHTLAVAIVANGIGNTQLRQGGPMTVIGNATAGTANVTDLSQTQLTALIQTFTATASGAVPAAGSATASQFLNAVGGFTTPTTATGANPSARVGLTAVNGTAATFMTSDSAPALNQAITPTWTGVHTFAPTSGTTTIDGTTGNLALTVTSGRGATESGSDVIIQRAGSTANAIGEGPCLELFDSSANKGSLLQFSGGQTELWVFNAGWAQLFKILASGGLQYNYPLGVNGVTPPAQVTGWGAPTGAAIVANFSASGATTLQTNQAVAEIITAMKAFGLFGA